MESFAYFLLGAIISAVASLFFYMRSGEELGREARRLRDLHEITLYILTNPGADIEAKRDADGHIVGVIVKAVGRA